MGSYELVSENVFDAPIDQVFSFFADIRSLQVLTPPSLKFEISTKLPVEMRVGLILDFRIRIFGVPIRWKSEITEWEPGVRFVDTLRAGPYKEWVHEHRFIAEGDKTRVRDTIRYSMPVSILGVLAHAVFVRRQLERIFDYRRHVLAGVFPPTP